MRFQPHTERDVQRMLDVIGVGSIQELFAAIPEKQRLGRPLDLPTAASEQEVLREIAALAARNASSESHDWFLGAGTYAHFVPTAVDFLASRSEFVTAYTPYQAEISQGTLQAIFEWQTMIAGLTGLDVANASMYDGASATAEAALMAMRATRRQRVVLSGALHPHYAEVVRTYLDGLDAEVVEAPRAADGRSGPLAELVDDATACVVVQQPNFLGAVEDLPAAAAAARARGALLVATVTEALSLGLLAAPGHQGADIVCGEAQSFGVPHEPSADRTWASWPPTRSWCDSCPGASWGRRVDHRGPARLRADPRDPRAAHPSRAGDVEHLHQPGPVPAHGDHLPGAARTPRPAPSWRSLNLAKAEYAKSTRARDAGALELPVLAAPTFNEFVVGVPGRRLRGRWSGRSEAGVLGRPRPLAAPTPGLEAGAAGLHDRARLSREDIDRLRRAAWPEAPHERLPTSGGGQHRRRLLVRGAAALRGAASRGRVGYSLPGERRSGGRPPPRSCRRAAVREDIEPACPSSPRWTWCATSPGISTWNARRRHWASTRSARAR